MSNPCLCECLQIETHKDTPPKATQRSEVDTMPMPLHNLRIPIGEQSPLTELALREHLDIAKVELLLKGNDNILKSHPTSSRRGKLYSSDKHILSKLLALAKKGRKSTKGKIIPTYHFSKHWRDIGQYAGRVFPVDSLSLACLRSQIRAFLCEGKYTDIDLVNAHPSALRQIFSHIGIDVPSLNTYVEHRDDFLRVMMSILKYDNGELISRKRAKNLFLRILYGGKVRSWIEGSSTDEDDETPPIVNYDELPHETRAFIDTFERETQRIIDAICEANPDVVAKYTRLKKPNPRASTASLFAQNLERKLLEAFFEFCFKKGLTRNPKDRKQHLRKTIDDGIPSFDGLMLLNEHIERSGMTTDEILRGGEAYILEKTGFEMKMAVKPFDYGYSMEFVKENLLTTPECVVFATDDELCNAVIKNNDGCFKSLSTDPTNNLYYRNPKTGVWTKASSTKDLLSFVVGDNRKNYPKEQKDGVITSYWAGHTISLTNALKQLPYLCVDDEWFLPTTQDSSLGKLLFTDGWYDWDTREFHEGIPTIHDPVFFHRANIPFHLEWDEEEAGGTLEDKIALLTKRFTQQVAFVGNLSLVAMIYFLARAIAGKAPLDRTFIVGFGNTTAGKGTLEAILIAIFGSYIGTGISPNSLCVKKFNDDDEKALGFLVDVRHCRLVICQEPRENQHLSSQLIKKWFDPVRARKLFHDASPFRLHPSPLFFGNDVEGLFDKVDEPLRMRLRGWRYDKSFCPPDKITDPDTQLPIDLDWKPMLETNKYYHHAFLQLLIRAYNNPDKDALASSHEITNQFATDMDNRSSLIAEYFTITRNYNDTTFIPHSSLLDLYKRLSRDDRDFHITFRRSKDFFKELENMGAITRNNTRKREYDGRVINKNAKIWFGITEKTEDGEVEEEEEEETEEVEVKNERILAQVGFEEAFAGAFGDED